ncbi:NAD(P)H-dependent glycerol-3-phosphate dehydrogenase [Helcococcus ovis]|uniref:Glycerol-3-phosphate dehydrogenase [NAD(P)+] n=3 Tax=Helcococcus ovis TaxID=72026 RepID=A0A4R9C258_9FIRM|nr:NAD(P)H-dependent glycerol-3-phosphate dehydrogenase [Helcococcus ovis]TFF64470.1 NAD(P)-dependent glycerol-3-phosphate dehydrogenase [Helcococcus ovis]TFF64682.1 NAD(P)-dependent glycerol-3-phosphate dehydrogenase [Helcococcus ovis]TFF68116.1 NAD(P)-dependent glycerol-3-phosphate dehydrogenase [Helcococcus ovis]WNZ01973.1 NAD(P)-dependent glycerol-3-phosphate dehydrogenase [Helcococcus ovis]
MEISVLGGGSWGTAISKELSSKYDVIMYVRNKDTCNSINNLHKNDRYLKDYILPDNIKASSNIKDVLKNKYVINAIPTQKIRNILEDYSKYFNEDNIIINLSKGIELNSNLSISEIFEEFLPNNKFVALSGPSHAEEVIESIPTSLVAASKDINLARDVQELMSSNSLRIYTNNDLVGVELGGAVKNVLALGIGILDGLGLGDNTKAAIMTRGIHEMTRFCVAMGGKDKTLYGLAGLGDLIVTATSIHSRNRKAGELIGKGHTISTLENEIGMVVESISTCKALYNISKQKKIYMPITEVIYKILYENLDIKSATKFLMNKENKDEFEF